MIAMNLIKQKLSSQRIALKVLQATSYNFSSQQNPSRKTNEATDSQELNNLQDSQKQQPKQPMFSEKELDEIFSPKAMKKLFTEKKTKEANKTEQELKQTRNTMPNTKNKKNKEEVIRDERLKQKIEESKSQYDFKFQKVKLLDPSKDKIYLDQKELNLAIRAPHIQGRVEELLRLFQQHQFSFNEEQCIELYKRIARAIPPNVQEGGEMAGTSTFKFRPTDDPRYTDRRMQTLLRKINDGFGKLNPLQVVSVMHSTIKIRFPEQQLITKCIDYTQAKIKDFSPKDTAIMLWALAKMNYPGNSNVFFLLYSKVISLIDRTPKIYDSSPSENIESLHDDIIETIEQEDGTADKNEEHPNKPEAIEDEYDDKINTQTLTLMFWAITKLNGNKIRSSQQFEEMLLAKSNDMTFQQISIIAYSKMFLLKELLHFNLCEAFIKKMQQLPEELGLEQIVHAKIFIQSIVSVKDKDKFILKKNFLDILVPKITIINFEEKKIPDARKKQGLTSNIIQIFKSLIQLRYISDVYHTRQLLHSLKVLTEQYQKYISPRDLAELVETIAQFKLLADKDVMKGPSIKAAINFEKELRVLAKRSALMLGLMNKKSRLVTIKAFRTLDFYDPDFTDAMKKLKII